jgi:hypothetical protein
MDRTDELLKELGVGLPFEVDWEQYQRDVLHRLARAEKLRRRRSLWLLLAGAVSGAAAMLLLTHSFVPVSKPARVELAARIEPAAEEPEPQTLGYLRTIRTGAVNTGTIRATIAPTQTAEQGAEATKPFTQRNGNSEIRFDGFSSDDAPDAGFIAARSRR